MVLFLSVYRYLFWTDWGNSPRIERSDLSGANRKAIVNNNLKLPNDLAIDHKSNQIYWIDAYLEVLESVDFDGNGRIKYNLVYQQNTIHPYSMALFSEKKIMYLTDWKSDVIYGLFSVGKSLFSQATLLHKNSDNERQIGQIRILEYTTEQGGSIFCLLRISLDLCWFIKGLYICLRYNDEKSSKC